MEKAMEAVALSFGSNRAAMEHEVP